MSSEEQNLDMQINSLLQYGAEKIYQKKLIQNQTMIMIMISMKMIFEDTKEELLMMPI